MEAMMEILEHELEEAVEVKNKKSLHRYIVLLTENIIRKDSYEKEQLELRSDIKTLAEIVKQGFEYMEKRFEVVDKRFEDMNKHTDKRFEDMQKHTDKRFEDMNKRFTMMFAFMNIGFTIIVLLTILFKFIA